jgi:hypothetical protein
VRALGAANQAILETILNPDILRQERSGL